ncbi:MAG: glutathione ABC transporter substrate-binding protein [Chitinophagales bacterium]
MSRLKLLFALLLAGFAVFATFGPALAASDTLTIANPGEAPTLDPNMTFNGYSFAITNQIFETLLLRDDDGLKPRLATSWKMVNDTTWRFELRKGVKFHDGTPFDAAAVKFSIDRLVNPASKSPGAYVLDVIKEVKVIDDSTVEIVTKYPFAPLLAHLTHPVTAIVSPAAAHKFGKDFGRNPVGTGPFVFKSWMTGDQVTLAANKNYWGGAPKVEKLVFRTIPETATQVVELRSGAVDLIINVPPDKAAELDKAPAIEVHKALGWGSTYLGFNTQQGPTADVRVRKAIALAIDRDAMVDQLRRGMAVKASAPIPNTVWGAAKNLPVYDYDVKAAKKLLAEAGYEKGFKIDLLTYESAENRQIAEAIQFQLGQIGITANVKIMDYSAYKNEIVKPDRGLFLSGWGTVTLDADYALYALFHSAEIPVNNNAFYKNAEVDKLLLTGRRTDDPKARLAAYQKAQEIINADLPMLTLYYPLFSYAKRTRLVGEEINYSWINMNLSKAFLK